MMLTRPAVAAACLAVLVGVSPVPGFGQEESAGAADVCTRLQTETPEEINFFDLRADWARDARYEPRLNVDRDFENALERIGTAMQQGRHDEAVTICDEHYLQFCASWVWNRQCHYAFSGAGQSERAERFSKLAFGLAQSVWASGDGRTPETAYRVLDLYEQELIYQVHGLTKMDHALVAKDGHRYDAIKVVDRESGEERIIYFNVDAMFDRYNEEADAESTSPVDE